MRLKQYIVNELFDTDVLINTSMKRYDKHLYRFGIDGLQYRFDAIFDEDEGWQIFFGIEKGKKMDVSITNTGNQNKVFAAVLKCLKIFLNKVKPDRIFFTAKEPSRQKLYDRMSKLLTKMFPYKIDRQDIHRFDKSKFYGFTRS
jgi:hypothetical protein